MTYSQEWPDPNESQSMNLADDKTIHSMDCSHKYTLLINKCI